MRFLRATSSITLVGILAGVAQAEQQSPLLQDGSYEVHVRLELPNVDNWAATKTAKAQATYTLLPNEFKGRIAMVLGGKNMTMREVQVGHRLAPFDLARTPQD